jgi:hypothetical protein
MVKEAEIQIVEVDLPARQQMISKLDTATGEIVEKTRVTWRRSFTPRWRAGAGRHRIDWIDAVVFPVDGGLSTAFTAAVRSRTSKSRARIRVGLPAARPYGVRSAAECSDSDVRNGPTSPQRLRSLLRSIVGDGPQLPHFGHESPRVQSLHLCADPDGVKAGLYGDTSVNHFSMAFGVVLKRPRSTTSPSSLRVQ